MIFRCLNLLFFLNYFNIVSKISESIKSSLNTFKQDL